MLGLCLAIAPQVPVGELWRPDLYNLKSKKLVGIVSVHNCSLRQLTIQKLYCYAPTPFLDFSGYNGKQSNDVAFYSSSVQLVARAGHDGRKCTESEDCRGARDDRSGRG